MKILVVRFSSIGDVVLTTPVFRCIKNQHPDAEIHFVTKKAFVGLVSNNPNINKVWSYKGDFKNLTKALKPEQFDVIIDVHNNLRTLRLQLALGVKRHTLNKLNMRKWLWVRFKINKMPNVHIVDRYLDVAKPLGVVNDHKGLDYFIPTGTELPQDVSLPETFICYAIGGQHATKKMPTEKIIKLCESIPIPVVLIGGKEDKIAGDTVANATAHVTSLCNRLTIAQSALVMEKSTWVISHDTGMMHIAAALKKKIVSIWGNTTPDLGMYPYLPHEESRQFEVNKLACRPCSKLGKETCPQGHFNCMNLQNLSAMAKVVSAPESKS